jgi:hypothetical protein
MRIMLMSGKILRPAARDVPLSEATHDCFDRRLENDPRFLQRNALARRTCTPAAASGWRM